MRETSCRCLQVAALLDDYSMVSFVPLDMSNEERYVACYLLPSLCE